MNDARVALGKRNLQKVVEAARGKGWITPKLIKRAAGLCQSVVHGHLQYHPELFESRPYHYAGKEYRLREGIT